MASGHPSLTTRKATRGLRWIENASHGLRLVGFADEICKRAIDHTGWYTDQEAQEGCARGVVYQLPARGGKARYVYGVADENNDDCALLDFDSTDDKEQAAHWADDTARHFAEEESHYQASWRAGSDYHDLGERIAEHRTQVIALCREARKARKNPDASSFPTICELIREGVASHLASMRKAREKRAELLDGYYQRAAFNDGACEAALS
jgi:hemerythrin